MDNRTYAKLFIERLNEIAGKNYGWETDTEGDAVIAFASVPTVVGWRDVGIFFNGLQVWAIITLAEGVDIESLSYDTMMELMYKMNNVTHLYNNLVVPVIVDNPNGGGVNVSLRSVVNSTSQNDRIFNDAQARSFMLLFTAGLVNDFITSVDKSLGTTVLADFMNMF
jgi:hypothetical protein